MWNIICPKGKRSLCSVQAWYSPSAQWDLSLGGHLWGRQNCLLCDLSEAENKVNFVLCRPYYHDLRLGLFNKVGVEEAREDTDDGYLNVKRFYLQTIQNKLGLKERRHCMADPLPECAVFCYLFILHSVGVCCQFICFIFEIFSLN